VGQIAYDKGVHTLIEAFLHLGYVPGIVLDIWGGLDNASPYAARTPGSRLSIEQHQSVRAFLKVAAYGSPGRSWCSSCVVYLV
jgi:hypothetical protein